MPDATMIAIEQPTAGAGLWRAWAHHHVWT
jgi:hypothetical protein